MSEDKLSETSIKTFLEIVASDSPAPGGGSVAAAVGAMGASLASMYCRLTIGKEKYSEVKNLFKQKLQTTENIRKEFTTLIDRDTEAFNQIMKAYRLPKNTESEKKERRKQIQNAYKKASEIPLKTAKKSKHLLEILERIGKKGNENAITDAATSALCGITALKAAILNIKINLNSIEDDDYVHATQQKIEKLKADTEQLVSTLLEHVKNTITDE